MATGVLCRTYALTQVGERAGWGGDQAVIPALLAQSLQNTVVLYHGTFGSDLRIRAKHLRSAANAILRRLHCARHVIYRNL